MNSRAIDSAAIQGEQPLGGCSLARVTFEILPFEILPIIESDDLIAIFESRESGVNAFRCSIPLEYQKCRSHRVNCRTLRFGRVNRNPVPHRLEPFYRQHR